MKSLLSLHIEANKNVIRITLQLPKKTQKTAFKQPLPVCTKVHKFAQFFRVTFCPSGPVLAHPEGDFVRAQKTVSFSRAGDGGTARVSGGKLHLSLKTAGMP
ncbi:hypothetical protein ACORHM_005030, partial [Escherichia coli]